MSLRSFHILFIICSIILSVLFGLWALRQGGAYLWTAISSFAAALGLIIYEIAFMKKVGA